MLLLASYWALRGGDEQVMSHHCSDLIRLSGIPEWVLVWMLFRGCSTNRKEGAVVSQTFVDGECFPFSSPRADTERLSQ